MRKFISVLMIAALAGTMICGCSKKEKEPDVEKFAPQQQEWYEGRAEVFRAADPERIAISNYEGVTEDGKNYQSAVAIADDQYRSIEVYIEGDENDLMYRYFDISEDLLYIEKVTFVENGLRYFVYDGESVYLYDKDNDSYSKVDDADDLYMTFAEALEAYAG